MTDHSNVNDNTMSGEAETPSKHRGSGEKWSEETIDTCPGERCYDAHCRNCDQCPREVGYGAFGYCAKCIQSETPSNG